MDELTVKQKLRRSFDTIYDRYPYLASIAASWKISESKMFPTAATDGPNLYYNPDFVASLSISECVDLWLHELGHIFLGHHLRFLGKPAKEWNVAADLALNDHIISHLNPSGLVRREGCFPGEGQFRDFERGKTAEHYYELVKKLFPPQPQPQDGEGEPGEGEGEGQGQGKGQGQPGQGQGKGKGLPQSIGEILPHPGDDGTEEAQAEIQREWEQQVARGINDAKACGNLPGWMEELASNLYAKKSEVDWKMTLRRFLTKYAPTAYTYLRPNRRHSHRSDVIMPARHGRSAAPGAILVDTSGSMSEPEMNAAFTEISSILSVYTYADVTMYQSDTRLIDGNKKFARWDFPLRLPHTWKGRGGTDLGPGIAAIGRERKYGYLLILSDMAWSYTTVPNPGIPTIWLMTRKPNYGKVPFGMAIQLPEIS